MGVITPFRAQMAAILHEAHQAGLDMTDITVDTVERYQGGARDIIIMSCAVNHSGTLDRISSCNQDGIDRKLNVAVTRARKQFIFTGVETVLVESPAYQALMEMCHRLEIPEVIEGPHRVYQPEA
jgi:DNA replication ATP-dependent helicase Dna2